MTALFNEDLFTGLFSFAAAVLSHSKQCFTLNGLTLRSNIPMNHRPCGFFSAAVSCGRRQEAKQTNSTGEGKRSSWPVMHDPPRLESGLLYLVLMQKLTIGVNDLVFDNFWFRSHVDWDGDVFHNFTKDMGAQEQRKQCSVEQCKISVLGKNLERHSQHRKTETLKMHKQKIFFAFVVEIRNEKVSVSLKSDHLF